MRPASSGRRHERRRVRRARVRLARARAPRSPRGVPRAGPGGGCRGRPRRRRDGSRRCRDPHARLPRRLRALRVVASGSQTASPDLPISTSVREAFARFGLLDDRDIFLEGPPARTLAEAPIGRRGAAPDRVSRPGRGARCTRGGVRPGRARGASSWSMPTGPRTARPLSTRSVRNAAWRNRSSGSTGAAPLGAGRRRRRPGRLADRRQPRRRRRTCRWSSVVYNMRREAARTLHSLSRSYQRGVEDLDYEVIVVENGSDPDQRLGEEFVRSFGPEFRYIDLAGEASPSPAPAVNRGIAAVGWPKRGGDDRRRARPDPGCPALRHARPLGLRAGCRHCEAVVRRPGPAARGRGRAATTARSRIACSRRSSGRPTAIGCSRSATSSAIATGSTASGRATASSSRAAWSTRWAAWTRASRCRVGASRTSTSSSA